MTTKADRYTRFDAADYLDGIDDAAAYLQIALEESEDDPTAVPRALGVIARSRNMSEVCSDSFDAEFIDKIYAEQHSLLNHVLMGALYLHIPSLLHLGCAKIASLIKGHPRDKVKSILVNGVSASN